MKMQKIPFHIVSGFLGSGKTTLLKRIIEKYSDETKIGIIQNEFAPANIDGVELKKSGDNFDLLEINNGSVFCVCLLGDFVRSLEKFIDEHQPDILVIECSGLSDTTSIAEMISAGKLAEKIYLASNWCIVDAQNFSKVGLMKQRVTHQLRMADVVVINKTDLIENGTEIIRKEIKQINPFAEIRESAYCNIDFELGNITLNKFYFDNEKPMARPNVHSMVIKSGRKLSREALEGFLKEWAPKAYRIKGFVNLKSGKTVAVQCTFGSVEMFEVEHSFHPTELVAITEEFTLREWHRGFKKII
jgi:G3E family GTPase